MIPIRRRLYQSLAGFTPRQLFAALQGAWLEPTPGYIWQENTGVTPTTTGGQTIGLMLDQSQGTVLGPELVTNGTFDSDLSGWTTTLGSPTVSAGRLTFGGTGRVTQTITCAIGSTYRLSVQIPTSNGASLIRFGTDATGATGSSLNTGTSLNAGTYVYYVFATATTMYLSVGTASLSTFDNISLLQVSGNHCYQSVAANRPLLGRRYNLLTYSEDFSNGAWTAQVGASKTGTNVVTAPDGTLTADSVSLTTTQYSAIYTGAGSQIGVPYTLSLFVRVPTGTATFRMVRFVSADGIQRSAIFTATTDWQRFSFTFTSTTTAVATIFAIFTDGTSGGDFYIWGADLRLTSDVGKDPAYQRITTGTDYDYGQYPAAYHDTTDSLTVSLPNLGGGVFSASGSVYFATPVGMSALHNQSMGTTYTLPALSSDIYSWIVVPQRLSTVQESRLERYMLRKANLTEPDYLLDDDGNQLMSDEYELLLRQ